MVGGTARQNSHAPHGMEHHASFHYDETQTNSIHKLMDQESDRTHQQIEGVLTHGGDMDVHIPCHGPPPYPASLGLDSLIIYSFTRPFN